MWRSVSCQSVVLRRSWEVEKALFLAAAALQTLLNNWLIIFQVWNKYLMYVEGILNMLFGQELLCLSAEGGSPICILSNY